MQRVQKVRGRNEKKEIKIEAKPDKNDEKREMNLTDKEERDRERQRKTEEERGR